MALASTGVVCFARKILWLHFGGCDKNSNATEKFYLNNVSEFGGVARYISADDGTIHPINELINIY